MIQARDLSINGYMVDPLFSADITSGKKINDQVTIMASDLEDNSIFKSELISFKAN